MDFFDEAVGKAKDIFDVARKKTGDAVNTGKLKLEIATIETKMAKDFEALGKIYFESIKDSDDLDTKTANIRDLIAEKQKKIDAIKEELER